MRQRRWMEYLEDYDFTLHYHLGKANGVTDALNRKSQRCWLVWIPGSGRCLRNWDSSGSTTRARLRVL